jgi:hypothetical protein
MGPLLEELWELTTDLAHDIVEKAEDGDISKADIASWDEKIGLVEQSRKKVGETMKNLVPLINDDLGNFYVFSLGLWARSICELAKEMVHLELRDGGICFNEIWSALKTGFKTTWWPNWWETEFTICGIAMKPPTPWKGSYFGEKEFEEKFAIRNVLSIVICFILGRNLDFLIFTRNSANMANTLSLLISHITGAAVQKNIKRLMAVVLGKSLPVLIFVLIIVVPCANSYRFALIGLTLVAYMYVFEYISFTSSEWGYAANLIAAFGTPILMTICYSEGDFASSYKEIGQVIVAIFIQQTVDTCFCLLEPRDIAIKQLKIAQDALLEGFQYFFEGNLPGMKTQLGTAQAALSCAESHKADCDPKLNISQGLYGPFKYASYLKCLNKLDDLAIDLSILCYACGNLASMKLPSKTEIANKNKKETKDENKDKKEVKDKDESEDETAEEEEKNQRVDEEKQLIFQLVNGVEAMTQELKPDIMKTLRRAFRASLAILEPKTEEEKDYSHLMEMARTPDLDALGGVQTLINQLNSELKRFAYDPDPGDKNDSITDDMRMCICVVIRALSIATCHGGELCLIMIEEASKM